MFDNPFHINVFVSLIELEHSLKTSSKRTHIALRSYFFKNIKKKQTLLYLFISLINVEHTLKTSNKRTHV